MRPQHNNNKNRNRNRNNRRHGGNMGGGGGGGGPNNRVLDSNGPDVKLRGTAQTIAEKYMQLARDAQSSGDGVMAESYYQHADHYYRLWLAVQPAGQPIQFSRRLAEEEMEDEADGGAEGDDENVVEGGEGGETVEGAAPVEGGQDAAQGEGQNRPYRQQRDNYRDNNQNNNRDNNREGGRERFKPRWPRRNDRDAAPVAEGQSETIERADQAEPRQERPERQERNGRYDRQDRAERPVQAEPEAERSGDWEAPSFLKRAIPVSAEESTEEAPAPVKKPRGRRPRFGEDMPPPEAAPMPTED